MLVVDGRRPLSTPAPPAVGEGAHGRVAVVQHARIGAVAVQKVPAFCGWKAPVGYRHGLRRGLRSIARP